MLKRPGLAKHHWLCAERPQGPFFFPLSVLDTKACPLMHLGRPAEAGDGETPSPASPRYGESST